MTKKQQLYADIAARHTPAGVRVVTLARGARASEAKAYGMAHRWPEDEGRTILCPGYGGARADDDPAAVDLSP